MNERILCVDDEQNVLDAYQRSLRKEFQLDVAAGGEQALALIDSGKTYAVVVSDMRMPGMDGVQLLSRIKDLAPETVRIMLTGNADQQTAIAAVNEGHIFRFLNKPCPPESLKIFLLAGIQQYRLVRAEKDLLEHTLTASLGVLTDVLAMVNPTAFGRASRVRRLIRQLAAIMKAKDAWQIEVAAMLSQLGCITVPEEVLTKVYEGQTLTAEELLMIDHSSKVAHDLISRIPRLEMVAELVAHAENAHRHQHSIESENFSTAPCGASLLNLALDFDKLIEARMSSSQAFDEIKRRGSRFSALELKALKEVVDQSETMFEVKQIHVAELEEHMILANDVVAANGVLLVSKGHEVTDSLRLRLENFVLRQSIPSSLKVFTRIETPSYRRDAEVTSQASPLVT
ncbi:MAG: hypothetical protein QOK48_2609 [Blastocatellia bacterium]|nr:hypothetical protein [Blastocatellia bacterium]